MFANWVFVISSRTSKRVRIVSTKLSGVDLNSICYNGDGHVIANRGERTGYCCRFLEVQMIREQERTLRAPDGLTNLAHFTIVRVAVITVM